MKRHSILLRLLLLVVIIAVAIVLAIWRGALWPLDPKISVAMTADGLLSILGTWWLLWALLVLFALPARGGVLVLLWLGGMLAALGLHGVAWRLAGLAPVGDLGIAFALSLYMVPAALAVWLGAAIGAIWRHLR